MKKVILGNKMSATKSILCIAICFCTLAIAESNSNLTAISQFLVSKDLGYANISSSGQFQGKLINLDDSRVAELSNAISQLAEKFAWEKAVNGRRLPHYSNKTDMIIALVTGTQQELQRHGVKETASNIFKGINQLPTLNGVSVISSYLIVYSQQRSKGVPHKKTILQMKKVINENR